MRASRQAGRAYDRDGNEIKPMTLGNMRVHGVPSTEAPARGLWPRGADPRRYVRRPRPRVGGRAHAAVLRVRVEERCDSAGLERAPTAGVVLASVTRESYRTGLFGSRQ